MAATICDKFIEALGDMNKTMKADIAAGHQWKYYNAKKRNKTFAAARKAKNYITNCASGVDWGLKIAGVPESALNWYGGIGKIVWVKGDAKAQAKKYFDIIEIKGKKTVYQLYNANELVPGDILTYMNFTHTNAYYGNKKSFDSGHAYCTGSGEGAVFKKWIGNLASGNAKVAYILRLKSRTHYRVQTGAFTTKTELNKHTKLLTSKKIKYELKTVGANTIVQVGYFSGKENATRWAADFTKKYNLPTSVEVAV